MKVRRSADQAEETFSIMKRGNANIPRNAPVPIEPQGLSRERALYLHRTVRQYVQPMYQDMTCPAPNV